MNFIHCPNKFHSWQMPELQAVLGMANETNKLVTGYQVEIDERFQFPLPR